MTKVLVVAFNRSARAGLTSLLRQSGAAEVTSTPSDLSIVDELARSVHAELIVTDEPESIGDTEYGAPVLAITNHPVLPDERVRGVLPADTTADELAAAIGAIQAGLVVIHPGLVNSLGGSGMAAADPLLTPREKEVLRMMAEGLGNKIIAHQLGISEHTVKFHVSSILEKLEAGSRTEAVTRGIRRGLVFL
jgi:DNA-binding NarL/FixJ family response regulator